jgi:Bardet-Biedl syndrome 1 protein
MGIADARRKLEFVERWQGQPLAATTIITCMTAIQQAVDEVRARSCCVEGCCVL